MFKRQCKHESVSLSNFKATSTSLNCFFFSFHSTVRFVRCNAIFLLFDPLWWPHSKNLPRSIHVTGKRTRSYRRELVIPLRLLGDLLWNRKFPARDHIWRNFDSEIKWKSLKIIPICIPLSLICNTWFEWNKIRHNIQADNFFHSQSVALKLKIQKNASHKKTFNLQSIQQRRFKRHQAAINNRRASRSVPIRWNYHKR